MLLRKITIIREIILKIDETISTARARSLKNRDVLSIIGLRQAVVMIQNAVMHHRQATGDVRGGRCSEGTPWVAQRVWAMPMLVRPVASAWAVSSATRPTARRRMTSGLPSVLRTARPAEYGSRGIQACAQPSAARERCCDGQWPSSVSAFYQRDAANREGRPPRRGCARALSRHRGSQVRRCGRGSAAAGDQQIFFLVHQVLTLELGHFEIRRQLDRGGRARFFTP